MEKMVTLNKKENKRLMVLNQVEAGQYPAREAAGLLSLSLRQVRRILAAYREEGATAIAHGNRGRKPPNALDDKLKCHIIELFQGKYAGFNFRHFNDSLKDREGIHISWSSVRNILMAAGIKSPKRRRPTKHRSLRERRPQEGMLLQIDASEHDWLEGRGPSPLRGIGKADLTAKPPKLTLIGAIDDATGKVPYAFFQEKEDSRGYFLLLREIVMRYGIPLSLYHDCDSVFVLPKGENESIEDQLEGKVSITQYGRLLDELGIASISAYSPQAKGRVERLWETFQDRLISELRLAQAKTIEEANKVVSEYLLQHNKKFAVSALQSGSAYLEVDNDFDPDRYFCFKHKRVVGGDNVVRFKGVRIQILPSNGRASFAHARVEVDVRLDGTLVIYYQGHYLLTRLAPVEATSLREGLTKSRDLVNPSLKTDLLKPYKPGPNHPWRQPFKVPTKAAG